MPTNNAKITMTTPEHAYVWKQMESTVEAYRAAAERLANDITGEPVNAMNAIGWMGDFVISCWEAQTAQEIMHGTEVIMKRESISAEDALEKAIDLVGKRTKESLLNNSFAAHSTSPASNAVEYYKAEAAARWNRDISRYTTQLDAAKKA